MKKQIGHVILPKRITTHWHFDFIKNKFYEISIDEIRKIAIAGDFPLRSYAIEYLWSIKDDSILGISYDALSDEDACIPAVFIIGEIGNIEDIRKLNRLFNHEEHSDIFKRHIKDAIEKILSNE